MDFGMFDIKINCKELEFAIFNTPGGQTCTEYLADYMSPTGQGSRVFLSNPEATEACKVCQYRFGSDYLATLKLGEYIDAWRDVGIVAIFVFSSYLFVYLLMKLRTKASKNAE